MQLLKMEKIFYFIVLLGCAGMLISCASKQHVAARSKTNFDAVYSACIDTVLDVNFSVSSSDKNTGLIVADQSIMGGSGGGINKLNIRVVSTGENSEVKVTYIPPPGTIGGWGTANAYIAALKKRVPDITVIQSK